MRLIKLGLLVGLVGCSNDVDPRLIPGGGVGDGEIDGVLNVHVIDTATDTPVGNAVVRVGDTEKTTNEKGLVTFEDVEGKQTIAVKVGGYRSQVWAGVNGANVTVPVTPMTSGAPAQATLGGTISGWDQILVATGHTKAAIVLYSQTDEVGGDANDIQTPGNMNLCIGAAACNWRVNSRTGTVTVLAAIIDRDGKGTIANPDDDTQVIIGYAFKSGITVTSGINQMGFVLDQVEAGNLQTVTVDLGTAPASLTESASIVGLEIGGGEIVQLPLFLQTQTMSLVAPKLTVFGSSATYRLTAVAQTTSGDRGAQSIVLRQGLTATTLAAGEWLVPPAGLTISRTSASFTQSAGAKGHSITWSDGISELLEISIFDSTATIDVPSLVALPATGALTTKVSALGVDFDVSDFSLTDDQDEIWGIATEPATVP